MRLGIDQLRARKTSDNTAQQLRLTAVTESAGDPVEDFEARERGRNLWLLAREVLSTDQHTVMWLRYAEDLNIQEIATVMERNPVAVRVMLFRARELLAERAGDDCSRNDRRDSRPLVEARGGVSTVIRGVS